MSQRQEPTYEGSLLGEQLSRFVNEEVKRNPALRRRCRDCAFREGTRPNAMAATLMDALKCVIEKRPFYCHLEGAGLCAGWEALIERKSEPGEAPWPFFTKAEP